MTDPFNLLGLPPTPPPMAEDYLVGDAIQITGCAGEFRLVVVDRTPTPEGLLLECVRVPDYPPPAPTNPSTLMGAARPGEPRPMTTEAETTAKTYLVVRDIQSAYTWSIDNGSVAIDGNPSIVLVQSQDDAEAARPSRADRVVCVDAELIGLYHVVKGFQPGIE